MNKDMFLESSFMFLCSLAVFSRIHQQGVGLSLGISGFINPTLLGAQEILQRPSKRNRSTLTVRYFDLGTVHAAEAIYPIAVDPLQPLLRRKLSTKDRDINVSFPEFAISPLHPQLRNDAVPSSTGKPSVIVNSKSAMTTPDGIMIKTSDARTPSP